MNTLDLIGRKKSAVVYKVVAVKGPEAASSPVQVGQMLVYPRNLGATHFEVIFDQAMGTVSYSWSLNRVSKVRIENGKVIFPERGAQ